jgi:hypothetical protein
MRLHIKYFSLHLPVPCSFLGPSILLNTQKKNDLQRGRVFVVTLHASVINHKQISVLID